MLELVLVVWCVLMVVVTVAQAVKMHQKSGKTRKDDFARKFTITSAIVLGLAFLGVLYLTKWAALVVAIVIIVASAARKR